MVSKLSVTFSIAQVVELGMLANSITIGLVTSSPRL